MKVIFLDIDGVLNVIPKGRDRFGGTFHKEFEDNLKMIIDCTGAKIVISSSWRFDGLDHMKAMWDYRKLPGEVIDCTPDCAQLVSAEKFKFLDEVERGHEIQEWLDQHPEVTGFVIIDDDSDMLKSQQQNFVRCANNRHHKGNVEGYGLTGMCRDKAIEILNTPVKPTHQ